MSWDATLDADGPNASGGMKDSVAQSPEPHDGCPWIVMKARFWDNSWATHASQTESPFMYQVYNYIVVPLFDTIITHPTTETQGQYPRKVTNEDATQAATTNSGRVGGRGCSSRCQSCVCTFHRQYYIGIP